MGLVDKIIMFEGGELSFDESLDLFSELLNTGMIYNLQGHYGRTMRDLIQLGWLDKDGNILRRLND